MVLTFTVAKQLICRTDSEIPVADSKNYLSASFTFSTSEWDGKTKTAIFTNKSGAYTALLDDDNSCTIPWEALTENKMYVSVFAGDLITANKAIVRLTPSGYVDGVPSEPSENIYNQIITKIDEIAKTGTSISEAEGNIIVAKEDGIYATGAKGEKGDKGDKGDSYVITDADYDAIADVVLDKLTTAESEEV